MKGLVRCAAAAGAASRMDGYGRTVGMMIRMEELGQGIWYIPEATVLQLLQLQLFLLPNSHSTLAGAGGHGGERGERR